MLGASESKGSWRAICQVACPETLDFARGLLSALEGTERGPSTLVVLRQDLDILVLVAAVDLVLNAKVGELHGTVDARQLVLAGPGFDLPAVAVRAAVAVGPVAVALLQESLVLALEVAFEDDTPDVGAALAEPLFGTQICAIKRRVMFQLAGVVDAAVEGLSSAIVPVPPVIAPAAVILEQAPSSLGQRDRALAFVHRDAANEPVVTEVADRLALVGRQVPLRHDTKRTCGGEGSRALAIQLVLPIPIDDEFAVPVARQFQVMNEDVAGIVAPAVCIPVAITLARFAIACVEVVHAGRIAVEADPLDVDLAWVTLVVARIANALNNLATILASEGRLEEAVDLGRDANGRFVALVGENESRSANTARNVAIRYLWLDRPQEGRPWIDRAVRASEAAAGPDARMTVYMRAQQAAIRQAVGDTTGALPALRAVRAQIASLVTTKGQYMLADVQLYLGRALLAAGRPAEAESEFRQALDYRRKMTGRPQVAVAECVWRARAPPAARLERRGPC